MANIKSDTFLFEAFTQELNCWWAQSMYIWVLRAQSLFGLTLIEYSDLLGLLVYTAVHPGVPWQKVSRWLMFPLHFERKKENEEVGDREMEGDFVLYYKGADDQLYTSVFVIVHLAV